MEAVKQGMLWSKACAGLKPNQRILVAVSGGSDSLSLLHLVLPEDEAKRQRLVVGYVHHDTGSYANKTEAHVRAIARRLSLAFEVGRVSLSEERQKQLGFEAAARELRYEALERIAQRNGCGRILTGHTADDLAEGVMIYLMRGAGLAGLAGPKRSRGLIHRLLLRYHREELKEFIEGLGVRFIEDPANLDLRYTRSRIRHHLRPLIEEEFGKGAWANLANSARCLSDADVELEQRSREVMTAVRVWSSPRWISLDVNGLRGYLAEVQSRILLRAYAHAAGQKKGAAYLSRRMRQRLHHLLHGNPGDHLELSSGVIARLTEHFLIFEGIPPSFEVEWKLPGRIELPDGAVLMAKRLVTEFRGIKPDRGRVEYVDAQAVGERVTVRPWHEGDRFVPLGRPGHMVKVVRALRINPSERRGMLWLVTSGGSIVFVAGQRIADPYRVKQTSQAVWRFSFIPPEDKSLSGAE